MKHLGDITKIRGWEVPIVDIIVGGSPCQDLSVAGKRSGLKHEGKGDDETTRSGLFMEQIRIIKEMRENDKRNRGTDVDIRFLRPRYMVWENVQGALSSPGGDRKGEDFRCVLEEVCRVADKTATIPRPPKGGWSTSGCIMGDGWSVAWRIHDAQFWGVPQRRKRIALVADFGGQTAPEILFERKSVSGDSEQSEQERQGTSSDSQGSINPTSYTIKVRGGADRDSKGRLAGKGALVQTELSGTLGVSQDQTLVCLEGNGSRPSHKGDGYAEGETMYTLNSTEHHAVCIGNGQANQLKESDKVGALNCMSNQQAVITYEIDRTTQEDKDLGAVCYSVDQGAGKSSASIDVEKSPTLATTHDGAPAVCYSQDAYDKYTETEKSATIKQSGGVYGGGSEALVVGGRDDNTVGALCARDYKGVGNQYVDEGKLIITRTDSLYNG